MKPKIVSTLDITLSIEVNTEESCARLLQTAIEVLLFQRNQIPFAFDLFRTIVGKITTGCSDLENPDWKSYQLLKQKRAAIDTLTIIEQLFKELTKAVCASHQYITAMLLFGSTVYTAKEAIIIRLPEVNRNHFPRHHRKILEVSLKQLAMKMTLSDELQLSGKISGQTNIFLLLEGQDSMNDACRSEWQLIEDYTLPSSCQQYVINLSHSPPIGEALRCCKEIDIFNDMVDKLHVEGQPDGLKNDSSFNRDKEEFDNSEKTWYQIGNVIKGYKDVLIKGKSIWEC